MPATKAEKAASAENSQGDQGKCLTIAERLALRRNRTFLDGSPNSSERDTRKRVAQDIVDERHERRS